MINHLSVKNIAEIAKDNCIKLIHISTDYVFDGLKLKPYNEKDNTSPKNVYGKTKLDGESAILSTMACDGLIIRTSWLYSEYGNNFLAVCDINLTSAPFSLIMEQRISSFVSTGYNSIILSLTMFCRYLPLAFLDLLFTYSPIV